MFSMIKFCITFCFCFLLMSLPINDKPLFFYLNDWASPFTTKVFKHTKMVFWESVEDSKTFGKKRTTFNLVKACVDALKKTNKKGDSK